MVVAVVVVMVIWLLEWWCFGSWDGRDMVVVMGEITF